MPELIEVEMYRGALEPLCGGRIEAIELRDPDYLRPKGAPREALTGLAGARLERLRRTGKLLLLDLAVGDDTTTIGLRFGMTGRLLVDGAGPIDRLVYSSDRNEEAWDRVRLTIDDRTATVRDPRRLGCIELDPRDDELGPDAAAIDADQLAITLAGRSAPVKAVLLNQRAVAGLGNLLADEVLWRTGLAPDRAAGSLDSAEIERLAVTIRSTIEELTERGGSHTGDTFEHRVPGAVCPLDGAPLRRDRFGGRTTWWCPAHQA